MRSDLIRFLSGIFLAFLICLVPFATAAAANQQNIPALLIFELSEEEIQKSLDKAEGSQYFLESLTRLPENMYVPEGVLTLEAKLVSKMRYNAPVQVSVAVKVNGNLHLNIVTNWRVRKFANVIVAARDLPSRTILSANDVIFETREVPNLDEVIYNVKDVIGLETKRPLTIGSTISKWMLSKPQLIRSGDNITILSKAGSVVVQVAGQALQGGAVGDVIRVRNLSSGKTILARIESDSTVVITYTTR